VRVGALDLKHDLRSFLEHARNGRRGDYLLVEKKVSPNLELPAIVAKLETKLRTPVLEFSKVSGTNYAVVTNLCASASRIAASMGWSSAELENRLVTAQKSPIAPLMWDGASGAPVQEEIKTGEQVDLYELPQTFYTSAQTHPYITAACVVAVDPNSGAKNVSYHRLMVMSRNEATIFMTPKGHLDQIFQKNVDREIPTSIAVFIGGHPIWSLGVLAGGGLEDDDIATIGGLIGEPLTVVESTLGEGLIVPALAEIVLEGTIRHDHVGVEGPFGEALGFIAEARDRPVFQVKAITQRSDAIFTDILPGHIEHLVMTGLAAQANLQESIVNAFRGVIEAHLSGPLSLYVKVDTDANKELDIASLMRKILEKERFIKSVVVFDNEVDLRNVKSTQWAIATHVQAEHDLLIMQDQPATGIDPSEKDEKTTKWGLDATARGRGKQVARKSEIPQEILDQIDVDDLLRNL